MVKITPFDVEQWMDEYENTPGVLNVAETCCSSISIDELAQFDERRQVHDNGEGRQRGTGTSPLDLSTILTYGPIRGSEELRSHIAHMYQNGAQRSANAITEEQSGAQGSPDPVPKEQVLITQGAISANYLVFYTLVGPGDHVICVFPTYQQLYAVPESLGAEVSLWELKGADGWIPDVGKLEALIKDNTKMIVINNPNNPTGATIPGDILASIVKVARKNDIILFSDEVYRPLFHDAAAKSAPPSVATMGYEKAVVTSSLSKAWALAGIRVGWITSPSCDLIEQLAAARDYITISVSQLDDQVARYALHPSVRPGLLSRNLGLAARNLVSLSQFVERHGDKVSWVKPTAGTTAFIWFGGGGGEAVDDVQFCRDVLAKTKVMLVPGSKCFGHGKTFKGYVRVGYVCETAVLEEALKRLDGYIQEHQAV
ncbi:hypothetical protein PG993_014880 [Apiospora rasikravindrae]|uniref:Aminotransferase class I/classII large domain-containing protein n=1 Tax=Apiospora rasikravindrae TaxID=990691 RepID=A0ABR1RP03_9PEZI